MMKTCKTTRLGQLRFLPIRTHSSSIFLLLATSITLSALCVGGIIRSAEASAPIPLPTKKPSLSRASVPLSPTAFYYGENHERILLTLDPKRIALFLPPDTSFALSETGMKTLPPGVLAALATEGILPTMVTPAKDGGYFVVSMPEILRALPGQPAEALLRGVFDRLADRMDGVYFSPVFRNEAGEDIVFSRNFVADFDPALSGQALTAILKSLEADPVDLVDRTDQSLTIDRAFYQSLNPAPPLPPSHVQSLRWRTRNGFAALEKTNAFAERESVVHVAPGVGSGARAFATQAYNADVITPSFQPSGIWSASQLWWIQGPYSVNAATAWGVTPGSPGILVGVVDRGSGPHDDLLLFPFDSHGYTVSGWPPVAGADADSSGPRSFEDNIHGTLIAGLINGKRNRPDRSDSDQSVTGVAPACPVIGLKSDLNQPDLDAFRSLVVAQANGVRITSHSTDLGSPQLTPIALRQTQANGMLHFVSTGNISASLANSIGSFAHLAGAYAIGAVDQSGNRVQHFINSDPSQESSAYGDGMAFAAPGENLISTTHEPLSTGEWSTDFLPDGPLNGTSYSTPIAAGVAALVLSANPALNSDEVFQVMRDTAAYRPSSTVTNSGARWNQETGYGIPDAGAAVQKASNFITADMAVAPDGTRWILATGFEMRQGFPATGMARVNILEPNGRVKYTLQLGQPATTNPNQTWFARHIGVDGNGNALVLWVNESRDSAPTYRELIQTIAPDGAITKTRYLTYLSTDFRTLGFAVNRTNNSIYTLFQRASDGGQGLMKWVVLDDTTYQQSGNAVVVNYPFYDMLDTSQGRLNLVFSSDVAINPATGEISVLTNHFSSGEYVIRTFSENLLWEHDFWTPVGSNTGHSGADSVANYDPATVAATCLEIGSDGTHYILFTTASGEINPAAYSNSYGGNGSGDSNGRRTRILGVKYNGSYVTASNPYDQGVGLITYDSWLKPTEYAPNGVGVANQHSPVQAAGNSGYYGYPQFWESPKTLALVPSGIPGITGNRPIVLWNRITPMGASVPAAEFRGPETIIQELQSADELSGPTSFGATNEAYNETYQYNDLNSTWNKYDAVFWGLTELGFETGQANGYKWEAIPGRDTGGRFVVRGPWTTHITAGRHRAVWSLQFPDAPFPVTSGLYSGFPRVKDSECLRLQVYDADGNAVIAERGVYLGELLNGGDQSLGLDFDMPTWAVGRRIELRAYWNGNVHVLVSVVSVSGGYEWSATDTAIGHSTGHAAGSDWEVDSGGTSVNHHIVYGPYTQNVFPGLRQATFDLELMDAPMVWDPTADVCDVDVYLTDTNETLATLPLKVGHFRQRGTIQKFVLPFELLGNRLGYRMEFRVLSRIGNQLLRVHSVGVDNAP